VDPALQRLILELLARHNLLTLATVREDGWPQATTVAYASERMTIYVATGSDAQKVRNIRRDNRVSLTIDHDEPDWNRIQGLSMAATAEVVSSLSEIHHATALLKKKFPALLEFGDPESERGWSFLRITPRIVSLIDYTRGFGHTLLVRP
jgi:PPOX class probable F420-dependent enzyme